MPFHQSTLAWGFWHSHPQDDPDHVLLIMSWKTMWWVCQNQQLQQGCYKVIPLDRESTHIYCGNSQLKSETHTMMWRRSVYTVNQLPYCDVNWKRTAEPYGILIERSLCGSVIDGNRINSKNLTTIVVHAGLIRSLWSFMDLEYWRLMQDEMCWDDDEDDGVSLDLPSWMATSF